MITSKALDLLGPLPSFESLGRELVAAIQNGSGCGLAVPQELADLIARARAHDADPNAVGSLCAQDPLCYEKPLPCPHHVEPPTHTADENFEHFCSYSNVPHDPWLRYAYLQGAGVGLLKPDTPFVPAPPAQGEWVLVPREPTDAMLDSCDEVEVGTDDFRNLYYMSWGMAKEAWKAMLAAAPQPAPELFPGTHDALDALAIREQPAPAPVQPACRCLECGAEAGEPCAEECAQPPAPVQVDNYRDAYEGAREDLLDWKGRALRAEATLRTLGYTGIDASQPPAPGEAELSIYAMLDKVYEFADLPYPPPQDPKLRAAIAALAQQRVPDAEGCHGLDTPERVFFYEQDFYVLSNFSSFSVEWCGHRFPTSEHVYHWLKFIDSDVLGQEICDAPSAHEAFKIAERNKDRRRADWDGVKVGLMRNILRAKARQHEYVRRKLLATGDRELVENSWRDNYWGWGPNRDGKNMLGKLWMEIRAELRAASQQEARGNGD